MSGRSITHTYIFVLVTWHEGLDHLKGRGGKRWKEEHCLKGNIIEQPLPHGNRDEVDAVEGASVLRVVCPGPFLLSSGLTLSSLLSPPFIHNLQSPAIKAETSTECSLTHTSRPLLRLLDFLIMAADRFSINKSWEHVQNKFVGKKFSRCKTETFTFSSKRFLPTSLQQIHRDWPLWYDKVWVGHQSA